MINIIFGINLVSILTEQDEENWIPDKLKKGALHRELGISEDKPIPTELLLKKKKELQDVAKGENKLSPTQMRTLRRVNFALNMRG